MVSQAESEESMNVAPPSSKPMKNTLLPSAPGSSGMDCAKAPTPNDISNVNAEARQNIFLLINLE